MQVNIAKSQQRLSYCEKWRCVITPYRNDSRIQISAEDMAQKFFFLQNSFVFNPNSNMMLRISIEHI